MKNSIEIKATNELFGKHFFIPNYQRGYRWGEQEVTELLDDVYQYAKSVYNRDNKVSKFYCLQPIVVKARNNDDNCVDFEVIDGQQRLTTLYIILTYLRDTIKILFPNNIENQYILEFETRKGSESYISKAQFTDQIDNSNVDFYHISKAYEYVKKWFKTKDDARALMTTTLLKSDYNLSVIWCQVESEVSSIDLFTRLNQGKIPLTDSELIKALILQSDRYPEDKRALIKQRLFEIASEWDEIEMTLNDPKMWLFLTNDQDKSSSKIELIFDILAQSWNENNGFIAIGNKKPKHYAYLVFDKYIESKRGGEFIIEHIDEVWNEVKEIFSCFQYWYNDHELFHYIGYLLAIGNIKIEKLLELSRTKGKKEFAVDLKKEIGRAIKITEKDEQGNLKRIENIQYGNDNGIIIKILLLFNVDTLIKCKNENAKFPFHLYKEHRINSIEHIHPQKPESIDADPKRAEQWLTEHKISLLRLSEQGLIGEGLNVIIPKIDSLLNNFDKVIFRCVYADIIDLYSNISEMKESELHTLYNLALVDKDTNSSLNNSFFDVKREILKEKEKTTYIPVCTQRAFSKYYSQSPHEMIFWADQDRKAYFNEIKAIYNSYVQ